MNSKSYWRRRAKEYEQEWAERCQSTIERELASYFRESLKEIEDDIAALYGKFARDNALSYSEARRLIRGSEFNEWRMSLKEYVATSHTSSAIMRELNTLAMRSRISRLDKLYSETLRELQKLGERSESAVKDFLTTAYRERYYHGIFDFAQVGKLEIPVSKVEPAKLEKVLASRWACGNFSSRIWKNTERLSQVLKRTITEGLHRGLSVQKMSKAINREMNSGYKNAERLVRTEMNFVQNHAAKESMESAGLSEFEFIATLDHRTSQRCRSLDGTVHLLEEYDPGSNAPPMHPRCRSTISAVISEGTRVARSKGSRNIRVPADMKYADYKAVYVDKTMTLKAWQNHQRHLQNDSAKSIIAESVKGISAGFGSVHRKSSSSISTPEAERRFADFQIRWKKDYNINVSDELKYLNFQSVSEAASGIETLLKVFPEAVKWITEFRISTMNNQIMNTSYWGQIGFNPNFFNSFIALSNRVDELARTGAHPKNTKISHYGAHEVGHILEIALLKKHGGDIESWKTGFYTRELVREAYNNIKGNTGKKIREFKAEISNSANDVKIGECLAEAVMDYAANKTNAAVMSQEICNLLGREFGVKWL